MKSNDFKKSLNDRNAWIVQEGGGIVTTFYALMEAGTVWLAENYRYGYGRILGIARNKKIIFIYDKEDALLVGKMLVSKSIKSFSIIENIYKKWEKANKFFEKYCRYLYSIQLDKLSNKEFSAAYDKFYNLYLDEFSLALLTDGIGFYVDEFLPSFIRKRNNNLKDISQYVTILSSPKEISFFEEEQLFLKYLSKKHHLNHEKSDFDGAFSEYLTNYYWINTDYLHRGKIDLKQFIKKIKNNSVKKEKLNKNKVANKKKKVIKILNFGSGGIRLIKLIELAINWQDRRKRTNMMGNYWLHTFNAEFSKRLNIKKDTIDLFSPRELLGILKNKTKLRKSSIDSRKKVFGMIGTRKVISKLSLEDSKIISESIISPLNIKSDIITGMVASRGKVRGLVRIITSVNDVGKISNGEILVCSMTRPELMPAAKKASAIITDEGGITCHAAIISRELKKPCIIGTKIATRILKDGDLVEVDANKGVVSIIKRK
jgi:phosphohistidine swiveling domain-containing protein